MADVVQFRLERMVDELEDLERRGLFTHDEISEVVRRRRDFEYRLKRPRPLKQDFLAYVHYEAQLDALRLLRRKKILRDLRRQHRGGGGGSKDRKKGGELWKRSISDVAGVLRILEIYRLAVVRYKGDLDLWFRYLEFCRERRHGRMKQVLAQAIRFHPKVPGLWIYAAAWEFDQNLNVVAARALMQNGLRECPASEDIWIEYLRMELTYLNKLKARKAALGEHVGTLGEEKGESEEVRKWKEENEDLFMSLDQGDIAEGSGHQQGALKESESFFWEQGSNILRTIYHGAVEAVPSSMSLRKRFLEILDNADLAHSDELKGEVMEDIKKQFSTEEDYWDWMARLDVCDVLKRKDLTKEETLCRLNKTVQVYEEALRLLPSAKMFSLYAKFLLDVLFPEVDETYAILSNKGIDTMKFASDLLRVYERAECYECLTDDLAHQYVSFYLQMGKLEEGRKLAERLCSVSKATNLWSLRISIEMKWLMSKSTSLSTDDLNHVFELLRHAVNKSAISETEFLWQMAIKFFSNRKKYFEKLVQSFMIQLAKSTGVESGYSISCAIVNWILQRDGVEHARGMYRRFLALPHPSLGFFRYCIDLESNLLFAGDSNALANARKIYDSALSTYSKSDELWKDYYSFEMKVGTSETANAVYWRCRKAHKDLILLSAPNDL